MAMNNSIVDDLYTGRLSMVVGCFPTSHLPERGAFNAGLALEFARQAVTVDVVSCQSVSRRWWQSLRQVTAPARDYTPLNLHPVDYLAFGRWCRLPKRVNSQLTGAFLRRAVERSLERLQVRDGVVYAIFTNVGLECLRWCQDAGVPLFLELPESGIERVLVAHGSAAVRRLIEGSCGIIADSIDNQQFCIKVDPSCKDKVVYVANAADTKRFAPTNKAAARKILGLPENEKIVVFCGHFIERKGPLRVLEALRLAENARGIFLGRGPQTPTGPLVLRAAPVPNSELPLWMNAGDVFVLPSLAEGLANVIVEAMSCGLPLVVSDRSFNRNFLDESMALFVDPESPQDIAHALKKLLSDDTLRKSMGENTLAASANFSISRRVEKIRAFIQKQVGDKQC